MRQSWALWLWLDAFHGETAGSDDVQKLAKSLNVDPGQLTGMGLLQKQKDVYQLRPPGQVDLGLLSMKLSGRSNLPGRRSREADVWEERTFEGFVGAAVWNAIALMGGTDGGPGGPEAALRWLRNSGYGEQREFFGAYAVTLYLLEKVFSERKPNSPWASAVLQAKRGWDLAFGKYGK